MITRNGESYVALIDAVRLAYYHRLERERIHLLVLEDVTRGLADIAAGRSEDADAASPASSAEASLPQRRPAGGVADSLIRVELTASFIERLESIETFLTEAGAPQAYDRLLEELRRTVVANLRRFPRLGRRYLDRPPQSAEAMARLAALPALPTPCGRTWMAAT